MWPNPPGTANLLTFTEEISNGKLHFLCSVELITKIRDDIYVNDLVTGGESMQKVEKKKYDSIELFGKWGFKLRDQRP